ncbi:alkaline phosphatase family protein [Desulforhopalus sp. 52FAK]
MNHSRVVVLGVDGMDFDYVSGMLTDLPNIKKLFKSGAIAPFRSVFPPDSIPSWVTCYTGKDPSEHGILESVNYLAKGNDRLNVDTSSFKGKTFWDKISDAGKSVCVVNPFMAYPVWQVNGTMVNGPVFIDGNIEVSDPSWTVGIKIPQSLGGIVDFPTRDTMGDFVEKTFADTTEQADFGLELLRKNKPDFYFQTFLTMDRIQHFLWRYCDPDDPTFPGPNPHQDSIRDFYIFIDKIIGEFLKELEPDDKLIVISDHGHGMRCTHCFNVNEFLRKHGYVHSVAEGKIFSKQLIIEKMKNGVLNFMNAHNLEDYISKIAKFIPNANKIKKGKHITKNTNNEAYASDFAGTNPFGGVCINKKLVDDFHKTRSEVMELLSSAEANGEPLFEWIVEREEMFGGEYLDRLPDILFCLKSKYGVNWNLHTKEITVNPTHKKISGGHKEYGVFFSNITKEHFEAEKEIKMANFFSTVLDIFGVSNEGTSKSKSFLRKKL